MTAEVNTSDLLPARCSSTFLVMDLGFSVFVVRFLLDLGERFGVPGGGVEVATTAPLWNNFVGIAFFSVDILKDTVVCWDA